MIDGPKQMRGILGRLRYFRALHQVEAARSAPCAAHLHIAGAHMRRRSNEERYIAFQQR